MFVIASSTARVTLRQSAPENLRSAAKRATVARTTHSKDESLGSANCNKTPSANARPLGWALRPRVCGKVFMCDMGKGQHLLANVHQNERNIVTRRAVSP